jgi:AcrR family transcriptional regulator
LWNDASWTGLHYEDGMTETGKATGYRLTAIEPAPEPDGRKHRSQKSQQKIVNAMLELVARGNVAPSADQIAEIAKVGRRSVFRHFQDMDALYREMAGSIAAAMESSVREKFLAADWRGKILEVVDRRALAFETLKPFLHAAQVHRHRSAFLKTSHAGFVRLLRQILLDLLPREAVRDGTMVEALDLLLSFETWDRLREDQGLDIATAKLALKHAIGSLLDNPT